MVKRKMNKLHKIHKNNKLILKYHVKIAKKNAINMEFKQEAPMKQKHNTIIV